MSEPNGNDWVARRVAFSEKHPGVHFTEPRDDPSRRWGAHWVNDGQTRKILRLTLSSLLDELETIFD
jgi:hypothetical protein